LNGQVVPEDRASWLASVGFDASVWEIWPYLTSGASIYILDGSVEGDVELLKQWLARNKVSISFLPTPLAEEIVSQGQWSGGRLRHILTGGDRLRCRPAETAGYSLYNHYGPTEDTVVATAGEVLPKAEGRIVPSIGRPISNTQVYLLAENLEAVPIGVVGEIYVGGVGLARGYLNRADLTAEQFIPNPFTGEGERLYRTGDLARYLSDGNIEFVGRADHQVKIRGYRIECGEVESVLREQVSVEDAVVVARELSDGTKSLVAYVKASEEAQTNVTELRSLLKEKLPDYMVPSHFIFLEEFPLTSSGKVDRKALPDPDGSRPELEKKYIAARTPKEEVLCGIWKRVLNIDQVGVRDNFFELGGDSIMTIQIVSRALEAGIHLKVSDLFEYQTVESLLEHAKGQRGVEVSAEQGEVEGEVELTPILRWFVEQEHVQAHHFNQSLLVAPRRRLKQEFLEKLTENLLSHHDALRMRLSKKEGIWQLYNDVKEEVGRVLSFEDLSDLGGLKQKEAIEERCQQLQESLDLNEGPLIKVCSFDLGAVKLGRLFIVIHHMAVDGVSWRILLEDLERGYEQLEKGKDVEFASKTTSFRSWAEKLSEYAKREELNEEGKYWLDTKHEKVLPLPVDFKGGENRNNSVSSVNVSLTKEETEALLREVPSAYHTQINDILLTGLAQTISKWTGREEVKFDLEGHGREEIIEGVDVSRTLGWFTTIYPVVLAVPKRKALGEVINSVKEQLRAIPHNGIRYGLLRYGVKAQEFEAFSEADISFNYLGQFEESLGEEKFFKSASENHGIGQSLEQKRKYLIDINSRVMEGRLGISIHYSQNIHREETIQNFALDYLQTLQELIIHCQNPESFGITPSDYDSVRKLKIETLEEIVEEIEENEEKYSKIH